MTSPAPEPPAERPPVARVLVVDDEEAIRRSIREVVEDEGVPVTAVGSGEEALEWVAAREPWVVLLDLWMPGLGGLLTLDALGRDHPEVAVVVMTGHGDRETAREAFRRGAWDYLEKPLTLDRVVRTLRHALEARELRDEVRRLRVLPPGVPSPAETFLDAPTLPEARRAFEREYLTRRLREHRGRVGPTARSIGVDRTNLYRKIRQLEIDVEELRGEPDEG